MRTPAGFIIAATLAASCAIGLPSTPSEAPPNGILGAPPVGCLGLDEAGCELVATAVLAALPPDTAQPTYLQAGPFSCNGARCPVGLVARPKGQVTVELTVGEPIVFGVAASGGRVDLARRQESALVSVVPTSARLGGPVAAAPLGHCGLFSGIDVDGSYWDPVGLIDADHTDAINSAEATFTLTSPTTAVLVTRGGLRVELVRHVGPKSLPGCD